MKGNYFIFYFEKAIRTYTGHSFKMTYCSSFSDLKSINMDLSLILMIWSFNLAWPTSTSDPLTLEELQDLAGYAPITGEVAQRSTKDNLLVFSSTQKVGQRLFPIASLQNWRKTGSYFVWADSVHQRPK